MPKINRQVSLKSLVIFTALVGLSLSLVRVNSDIPKFIGIFALASLTGGAIGFAVSGRTGYVYWAILLAVVISPPIYMSWYIHDGFESSLSPGGGTLIRFLIVAIPCDVLASIWLVRILRIPAGWAVLCATVFPVVLFAIQFFAFLSIPFWKVWDAE